MTILLSDPRVSAVPVIECGEPLVALDAAFGGERALVRSSLATRLEIAAGLLPPGISLQVVEGHRPVVVQQAIIARYSAEVCTHHPGISADELDRLTSRFVAPLGVAPHVAGAAVDLTLVDACGDPLDLGTAIDATPEQSAGRCYLASSRISADARAHRDLLADVLGGVGLVNYPTEWWHWSYGDRYWALISGADTALYGPISTMSAVA